MAGNIKNFISAVVYVHNDEASLKQFLSDIHRVLSASFDKYEFICVNDASTDKSIERIKAFAKDCGDIPVRVITMSYYQGKERSMNAGVDLAIGDFVYEFDSVCKDYDDSLVLKLYNRSLEGYDIVSAVPDKAYRTSSKLFYRIFNKASINQYPLKTERFRILSRRAVNRVHSMSDNIIYRKAFYTNCGLKIDYIVYEGNIASKLKLSRAAKKEERSVAINAIILFTDVAYKISMTLAGIMMAVAIFIACYAIYMFLGNTPVEGWTTTMLVLAFGFFGIFAMFAMLTKYMSVMLSLIFNKQKYVFEDIENINK